MFWHFARPAIFDSQLLDQNTYTAPAFDAPVRGGGSRRNIAIPFGMEKLEWLGYPMVKKILRYLFVLAQLTNVTDRRTDRQTPHDGNSRAYA